MIQLAVPVGRIMDPEPLTVEPDDVLEDVTPEILDVEYRAAVVVDPRRRPLGLVGRSALVSPAPRKVVLVDHAEESQSAPGIEQAEIVEILDHHHIGSIETHLPVRATFDPVGSTATLVAERFAAAGLEPGAAGRDDAARRACSRTPSCSPRRRRRTATAASAERSASSSTRTRSASGARCSEASSDVSELSGGGDRGARRQDVRARARAHRARRAGRGGRRRPALARGRAARGARGRCARRAATRSRR